MGALFWPGRLQSPKTKPEQHQQYYDQYVATQCGNTHILPSSEFPMKKKYDRAIC